MEGSDKLTDGMVRWIDGRVKPSWRHGPLDRWKGQTKLADGMVRWTDGKGETGRSLALVGGRALCPAPGPENSRDSLGTPGRYARSSLDLPFPRSVDKIPTSARGGTPGHSPKHPTCWVRRGLARLPGMFPLESLERVKRKLAHGMVHWGRWKGQTKTGARHRPLGSMEGVKRASPWFWWVIARSDPLRFPRIRSEERRVG